MVECSISRWAKILLIFQLFLIIAEAQSNGTQSRNSPMNAGKPKFAYNKKQIVQQAVIFRFNILIFGGILNMTLSVINLILALLNFYLTFGRYDARLRQVAGKLKIAVDEMSSRDLHPKIKMALSRVIPPNTPIMTEVMKIFKEPSKMFDNANGLLADQKEARLRKLNVKKEKEENTSTMKSPAPKSEQASAKSNSKSTVSEAKKQK